jgi:hypothetical protein
MLRASQPQDFPGLFLQALKSGGMESVGSLYDSKGIVAPDLREVLSTNDVGA